MNDFAETAPPPRTCSLDELAALARQELERRGLTQAQAADELTERFAPERGERFQQPQISAALNDPRRYPSLVRLLVEAFTEYAVDAEPRYTIRKRP